MTLKKLLLNLQKLKEILEALMNNTTIRILVSLLALPLIYFIIFKPIIFNFVILISIICCIYEWFKLNTKKNYIFILGIIFLVFFSYACLSLYNASHYNFHFLWLIIISWLTDIGGFIFGKLFKWKKLTKISPKKTWSGVIGSFVLSQLSFLVLLISTNSFSILNIIFFQSFLCLIGQLGDLLMSFIKRKNKVKDSSNLIPGHGGFLDRLDGFFWIIIFAYIFKI
jgi:phosphatidate cytidylyltransferase